MSKIYRCENCGEIYDFDHCYGCDTADIAQIADTGDAERLKQMLSADVSMSIIGDSNPARRIHGEIVDTGIVDGKMRLICDGTENEPSDDAERIRVLAEFVNSFGPKPSCDTCMVDEGKRCADCELSAGYDQYVPHPAVEIAREVLE